MEKFFINNTKNYYRTYFLDNNKRPTVVISAGGGYKYTSPRESEPVQEIYNQAGFHVVIVNYRETDDAYPVPSNNLAYVLKLLRNDDRVGEIIGLGFSAGGHNMLEVTLHYQKYGVKPDLIMLGYPVVTSNKEYFHEGSFINLLKEDFNKQDLMTYLSLETQVTSEAPDLFLWGTFTDESVNVMNSLLLLEAYKKNNCNAEYHLYPMGGHGLSVANAKSAEGNPDKINPYIGQWIYQSIKWINLKLNK
ncbi:MAG: alpha/beta hydrolase [Anaeroplasma sp.]